MATFYSPPPVGVLFFQRGNDHDYGHLLIPSQIEGLLRCVLTFGGLRANFAHPAERVHPGAAGVGINHNLTGPPFGPFGPFGNLHLARLAIMIGRRGDCSPCVTPPYPSLLSPPVSKGSIRVVRSRGLPLLPQFTILRCGLAVAYGFQRGIDSSLQMMEDETRRMTTACGPPAIHAKPHAAPSTLMVCTCSFPDGATPSKTARLQLMPRSANDPGAKGCAGLAWGNLQRQTDAADSHTQ